ncbi:aminotransferase-like domain-containing protein [Pseudomonas urmiensis]|jgi:DNA-binding transcriptional MocR family regulator|uniref:aminotransferase-like domain-containing protein n=1 Tax=Pseudomonas urmiensis TaxID=2745493 RepID=UPI0034D78716
MSRSARGEFAYQTVYRYLERLIGEADRNGEGRLPSLRDLARRLRVSLATVQSAYSLLEHEGRVRSVPKSGYFVRACLTDEAQVANPRSQRLSALHVPLSSSAALERALLRQERRLSRQSACQSGPRRAVGGALLRNALAARYTRSSRQCWSAEDVHLATDVQALLQTLLCALHLRGATALVASPCCWRLLRGLQLAGLRVLEVPLDAECGLDLDVFARLLAREPVRLVVMPACLSLPTGRLLTELEQHKIAALLAEHPAWLLENDLDSELSFAAPANRRLRDWLEPKGVLVLGSLEAEVGAEAPYAFVLCRHAGVAEKFAQRGFLLPPLRQQALAQLYVKGEVDCHLAPLRREREARMQLLCQQVQLHLGEWVVFCMPQGGQALWVRLHQPLASNRAVEVVAGSDLLIVPGDRFSLQGRFHQCLLLAWEGTNEQNLQHGLRLLSQALQEQVPPEDQR